MVIPLTWYRHVWLKQCKNDLWWDWWYRHQNFWQALDNKAAAAREIASQNCASANQDVTASDCHDALRFFGWAIILAQLGVVPFNLNDFDVLYMFSLTRERCPTFHYALRSLFQGAPILFKNKTAHALRQRRFQFGAMHHIDAWLRHASPDTIMYDILQARPVFIAMRILSEMPFIHVLRQRGVASLDKCISTGFNHKGCRMHSKNATGGTLLLEAFYRYRDPGLPENVIQQLSSGPSDYLTASWVHLAVADRQRNLGEDHIPAFRAGVNHLQRWLRQQPAEMAWLQLLPREGAAVGHLVWHFLDKLSLELQVEIGIARASMPRQNPLPGIKVIPMFLLPDHDIVSDSVRRDNTFHCSHIFYKEVAAAVAEAANPKIFRIVEVGGFLGDCILWAAALVGRARFWGLEVEPSAAATARLTRSLEASGLSRAVTVVTEAVGDGKVAQLDQGLIAWPANPNSNLLKVSSSVNARQLRTMDEVLSSVALPPRAMIDVLRIKAAGNEPYIMAGLKNHLRTGRIRRLIIESSAKLPTLAAMPWYRYYSPHPSIQLFTLEALTQPSNDSFNASFFHRR